MFEKVSQLAERAATSVSRRQFLGRLGRGAMIAAAATAGLLALPGEASARGGGGGCPKGTKRCHCGNGRSVCCSFPSCLLAYGDYCVCYIG